MCLMASANLVGLPALLCEALGAHLYRKAAEAVPGSHANKTFGADWEEWNARSSFSSSN